MQKLVLVINGINSGEALERWVFNLETSKEAQENRYVDIYIYIDIGMYRQICRYIYIYMDIGMYRQREREGTCRNRYLERERWHVQIGKGRGSLYIYVGRL